LEDVEKAVVEIALEEPAYGQKCISNELRLRGDIYLPCRGLLGVAKARTGDF